MKILDTKLKYFEYTENILINGSKIMYENKDTICFQHNEYCLAIFEISEELFLLFIILKKA